MTMIAMSAAALPAETQPAPAVSVRAQDLFEHMAAQSHGLPQGTGPAQLAHEMLDGLRGFLENTGRYSRLDASSGGQSVPGASNGFGEGFRAAAADKPPVGENQMKHLIDSLGRIFSFSTEVAVVARNTSGISSSINTLLRGQ